MSTRATEIELAKRLGGERGIEKGLKRLKDLLETQEYRAKLIVTISKVELKDKEEEKHKIKEIESFRADRVVITDSGIFFLIYLVIGDRKKTTVEYVRKFMHGEIDSITVDYENFVFIHLKDGRVISIRR